MQRPENISYGITDRSVYALSAGVDWLTVTAVADSDRIKLYRQWRKAKEMQKRAIPLQEAEWSWRGYRGVQVSHMAWGSRKDSDILVTSGSMSAIYWRLFVKSGFNVTRLDIAVTANCHPPCPDLLNLYWENLTFGANRKAVKLEGSDGGGTLYIGSRRSDNYGRIYDKGIESDVTNHAGAIWRYEVEFKQERARSVANQLQTIACNKLGPAKAIVETVYKWFDDRECPPIFHRQGGAAPISLKLKVVDTTTEKQLTWLRLQVSPVVKRLLKDRRKDVLDALGLADLEQSTLDEGWELRYTRVNPSVLVGQNYTQGDFQDGKFQSPNCYD